MVFNVTYLIYLELSMNKIKKIISSILILVNSISSRIRILLRIHPKVSNIEESLQYILKNRISISRYGDGEILLMEGISTAFQAADPALATRLKEVSRASLPNHRVCIPGVFNNLSSFNKESRAFWQRFLFQANGLSLFNKYFRSKSYLDTHISRFYEHLADKTATPRYLGLWREIFFNRHLLLVEGTGSKLGFYNDLFRGAASVRRIVCPAENAFAHYQSILETTLNNTAEKDCLVLIALGPTATVLAYDLSKYGVQALDVGHIDIEYEWFKMGATRKVPVPWRYVNETKNRISVQSSDPEYTSQVIALVGLS